MCPNAHTLLSPVRTGDTCSDVSRHLGMAAGLWLLETPAEGLGLFLSKTLDSMDGYRLRVCPSQYTGHETPNIQSLWTNYQGSFFPSRTKPAPKAAVLLCPSLCLITLKHPLALGKKRSYIQAIALNHQVCLLLPL